MLIKNKQEYENVLIDGLSDKSLAMILLTFFISGILSVLLTKGGLCDGLVYLAVAAKLPAGLMPVIIFFLCVLISTSTGTTSGTVAAATPVLLPLAVKLGCNPALVMGAIVSGGFFGDNLAPVSDTTIASAATQETDVTSVVRSRLKYSVVAGGLAALLYIWQGFSTTVAVDTSAFLDPILLKGLVLFICPVLLIVMMLRGKNFVNALMTNTILAALICILLGKLNFDGFFGTDGAVAEGIGNCMSSTILCMLIFIVIRIMKVSGVFEILADFAINKCKTHKQAEVVVGILAMLGSLMMGGATYSIILSGGLTRNLMKNFNVARTRGANILDGLACGTVGLLPYGGAVLFAASQAAATGLVDASFNATNFIPYTYHCMILSVVYWFAMLTGWGAKFENAQEAQATQAAAE
jgi:Na+/H+ antiporter NhaC